MKKFWSCLVDKLARIDDLSKWLEPEENSNEGLPGYNWNLDGSVAVALPGSLEDHWQDDIQEQSGYLENLADALERIKADVQVDAGGEARCMWSESAEAENDGEMGIMEEGCPEEGAYQQTLYDRLFRRHLPCE